MFYRNVLNPATVSVVSLLACVLTTQIGCGGNSGVLPIVIRPEHDSPMAALNGTFENLDGWAPISCSWESDASLRDGALAITSPGCIVESNPVTFSANSTATVWKIDAQYLIEPGGCVGGCGLIWVRWYDSALNFVEEEGFVLASSMRGQWETLAGEGVIPTEARYFRVAVRGVPTLEAPTTLLVDNITVRFE